MDLQVGGFPNTPPNWGVFMRTACMAVVASALLLAGFAALQTLIPFLFGGLGMLEGFFPAILALTALTACSSLAVRFLTAPVTARSI